MAKNLELKKKVFAYHLANPDVKFYKYHTAHKEFPKSHHTIKKWIKEIEGLEESGERVAKSYKRKVNKENKSVFAFLEADTAATITSIELLKSAIQHKALAAKDDRFTSIKDIAITYGIMIEKEVTIQQLAIDQRKLEIAERQLVLKEKELELRIQQPEAFSNVTIINDLQIPKDDNGYADKAIDSDSTSLS